MKKLLFLIPFVMLITACSDTYRYPCQDPENWEQKQCKKPYCSANGTCPEDLTHYEKKNLPGLPAQNNNIGECK